MFELAAPFDVFELLGAASGSLLIVILRVFICYIKKKSGVASERSALVLASRDDGTSSSQECVGELCYQ